MKKILMLSVLLLVWSWVAVAGEWQGYVMDSSCAAKMKDKAAGHKTKCAIGCSKGGYGLVTSDGKFVKFDETGNAKALEALKGTTKDQDLMAKVTGTLEIGRAHV